MDQPEYDPERSAPLLHLEKMGAVARLARGISRDVGEQIAAAAGAVREALSQLPPHEPSHEALGEAAAALQRAGLIARQLEMLARPAATHPEPRSLGIAIDELLPLVRRLAGSDLTVAVDHIDHQAWIVAEAGQVEQVLFHLVVNARDATLTGGGITIGVGQVELTAPRAHRFGIIAPGSWCTLTVRDSGSGMDDQVLSRLFEPFFTTKPAGQGSGLGLATVYGIARQLDGQVTVESTPGAGSTITVWLPAVSPVDSMAADGGAAVLVVEDDEWVRAVTARALRRAGHGVLEAADAESALDLLRDVAGRSVRVVLSDIVMPGMWGDALARRIAAERADVRTVLMTGRGSESLPDPSLAGVRLLRKPFSRRQLLAAVAG